MKLQIQRPKSGSLYGKSRNLRKKESLIEGAGFATAKLTLETHNFKWECEILLSDTLFEGAEFGLPQYLKRESDTSNGNVKHSPPGFSRTLLIYRKHKLACAKPNWEIRNWIRPLPKRAPD